MFQRFSLLLSWQEYQHAGRCRAREVAESSRTVGRDRESLGLVCILETSKPIVPLPMSLWRPFFFFKPPQEVTLKLLEGQITESATCLKGRSYKGTDASPVHWSSASGSPKVGGQLSPTCVPRY